MGGELAGAQVLPEEQLSTELSVRTLVDDYVVALLGNGPASGADAWFAGYQSGILPTPWDQDPAADVSKL